MTKPAVCSALTLFLTIAVACGDDATIVDPPMGDSGTSEDASAPGQDSARPPIPADCTDGVDCLCDRLAGDSDIVFCEDMEDASYNGFPAEADSVTGTYPDLEGNGWFLNYFPQPDKAEGTCDGCSVNIVAESDGQCEVPGETDCVHDGSQALGHRLMPGRTGGIIGSVSFEGGPYRTFGVTYALRYTDNFVDPSPAMKTNEFGVANHCFLGCSTGSAGRNVPFGGAVLGAEDWPWGSPEVLVGNMGINEFAINFSPLTEQYEWRGSMQAGDDADKVVFAPGRWGCQQVHWRGWGTESAEYRAWMDGKLVVHIRNIDMRELNDFATGGAGDDEEGIDRMVFNHYYNAQPGLPGNIGTGYPGDTIAYRYEDNFVVTSADEPVSCADIGF